MAGLCGACSRFGGQVAEALDPLPVPQRVQGANVRPVGDVRRGYGSSTARRTFQRLKRLGVNTVGILLNAQLRGLEDPSVQVDRANLERARHALLDARELGLATVLVPQLVLEDGTWRGNLNWTGRPGTEAWWDSYRRYVLRAAQVARTGGASLLSLGVELKSMSGTQDTRRRMSGLAQQARSIYSGPLTYHANWDEAEDVAFWDGLDLVGVNGYYPLRPDPVRGAEAVAVRLKRLARRTQRPLLVLEVGFRSSPHSHREPWAWPDAVDPVVDLSAQAQAFAAVLGSWPRVPGVRGLLVWVVPTDPDDPASEPRHGFNPLNKPAEGVLARAFGGRMPRRTAYGAR